MTDLSMYWYLLNTQKDASNQSRCVFDLRLPASDLYHRAMPMQGLPPTERLVEWQVFSFHIICNQWSDYIEPHRVGCMNSMLVKILTLAILTKSVDTTSHLPALGWPPMTGK